MTAATRVLLVEDHAAFRQALEAVCELEDDLVVVGAVGHGDEVQEAVRATCPDVVVVDLDLPGVDGVTVIRTIQDVSAAACVVLTGLTDDIVLGAAVEAGAAGVLHKSVEITDVLAAIRTVAQGGNVLDPTLSSRWLRHLHASRQGAWRAQVTRDSLSPRELEVLERLVAGLSVRAMAQELAISEATVETHLRNLRSKLDATSRLDAVLAALRLGIVDPPSTYHEPGRDG